MDYVQIIGPIIELFEGIATENDTNATTETECEYPIPDELLYQFLLIPAVVFTLILSFAEKRVHQCLQCLSGRPGVAFPMNIMGRSNRFSYAAAFGATASLCLDVIIAQKYAVTLQGPAFLKVFSVLLSMLIYGLDYLPLFTALTANSSLGYAIATLYAWALTAITFTKDFWCKTELTEILVMIGRNLPELLCHLYLSISCPVRFVRSLMRKRNYRLAVDIENDEDIFDAIRDSYQGLHVRKLFNPPQEKPTPPTGFKEKAVSRMWALYHKIFYQRMNNFRYSTRMLSVSVVSFIVMHEAYVDFLYLLIIFFEMIFVALINLQEVATDEKFQDVLNVTLFVLYAVYVGSLTSLTIGFILGCIMILHTLASYRNLLLGLYKGDNGHLTPKSEKSNSSLLIGCMRYAGFQVAYVAWGYLIQFIVLFVIAIVLAAIILLIMFGIYEWILTILNNIWPVLLISFCINILQKLMATFAFLQERGKLLAINNRRVFFLVVYFMFFYNIFLGMVSCLMRIIKAIILGTLFLPRLDHSTLPRKFQALDPGFDAFCGFMHVENAHTHPIVLTFISLVEAEIIEKKKHKRLTAESVENGSMMTKPKRYVNTVARFKWKLAYTLIKNPKLFIERKDALLQIFQHREFQADDDSTRI